jgi:hypothetical protein
VIFGFPRRPIRPIHPIFPVPPHNRIIVVGVPFFGFGGFGGFGFGFNSFWAPACPLVWGWGYNSCYPAYPYYDSDYYAPAYNPNPSPGYIEPQLQPQAPLAPSYVYGGGSQYIELYLKDGTIYYVTDYWLVNGELHFTTVEENGTKLVEHTIDFSQLDLQRSINVNTERGFRFVLRNEPIDLYLEHHPEVGAPAPPAR